VPCKDDDGGGGEETDTGGEEGHGGGAGSYYALMMSMASSASIYSGARDGVDYMTCNFWIYRSDDYQTKHHLCGEGNPSKPPSTCVTDP